MAKDAIAVHPSRDWMGMLEYKRPDLLTHGRNYAIECLIADACGVQRPEPPLERVKAGARTRGNQLRKK
jgi:hypothetical protein